MPRRRRPPAVMTAALLVLILGVVLGGCFTGERPSFADDQFAAGRPSGDPAIDAVLATLDAAAANPPTFTASYDVTVRFGNVTKHATVVVDGRSRSVTMDDVHYLQTPEQIETCRGTTCTTGLDAAAISDSQLTVDFYAADAAKRMRVDAGAKIGPTASSTQVIAGQEASCVDIVQPSSTATYCVLDDGVLATLIDGDVYVTMTAFSPTADPTRFDLPGETTTTT